MRPLMIYFSMNEVVELVFQAATLVKLADKQQKPS